FYCKDAFEGLATIDALMDNKRRPELLERIRQEAEMELGRAAGTSPERNEPGLRSSIQPARRIPRPPGWGPRLVRSMPLDAVFQHLAKNELFRLSWGAKNTHGEAWIKLQAQYEQRLDKMRRQALNEPWLFPQGIYGYWPAQSDGNELVVYAPESLDAGKPLELQRFSFPRQPSGEYLSLADYFAPLDSGLMDVVAFQIVTVGDTATERFEKLHAEDRYSESYFLHGLAVQMAEAAAEYLHRHIRRELSLEDGQGKRYSWGYPAIPDLADHRKVFALLPAERELNISLTAAYQLVPVQSTAAIIVHHPQATYFNIGERRIDQLMSTL
ncbi:MAG: vitamin B12 dependent-methionine synthase activation domain-containing protein, partial [Anaerolineaceae bacterium]